jgi:dihydroflavonol-4-reductase
MTVLITGATGHIGANLARALIEKGISPRCMVHVNDKPLQGLDIQKVQGDVREPESLLKAFQGVDTVYHLAGNISLSMDGWQHLEEVNVTGTRNVVQACLQAGVKRLVHFSSIHAFDREPVTQPVDESNPLVSSLKNPPYDRSKAAGTLEVRKGIEKGLDAVIIHPTAVIGPYDFQPSYLGEAILMMARGRLPALVPGGYDWVDVRDIADGTIMAAEKAPTGSAYLLGGHWTSMADMAEMIAELTGKECTKFMCPLWLANAGAAYFKVASKITGKQPLYTSVSLRALQDNKHISHEKAVKELDYNPRPLRDTLEDTLRWFHENGRLELHQEH